MGGKVDTQYLSATGALASVHREVALAFLGRDAVGEQFAADTLADLESRQTAVQRQVEIFEGLPAAERVAILQVFFGPYADVIEATWQRLAARCYGLLPPFRAPRHPRATLAGRWFWLSSMLSIARGVPFGRLNSGRILQTEVTLDVLSAAQGIATEIDAGGGSRERLLAQLRKRTQKLSDDDLNGWLLAYSVWLSSQCEDSWQLVWDRFESATPAYDHRLAILKLSLWGNPRAVLELAKFLLANPHWFDDWLVSARIKSLLAVPDDAPGALRKWLLFAENAELRRAALADHHPREVHLALWAEGWTDVVDALEVCQLLQADKDPQVRCVAARFVSRVQLPEFLQLRAKALADAELRVASTAAFESTCQVDQESQPFEARAHAPVVDGLLQLLERLRAHTSPREPCEWPFCSELATIDNVSRELVEQYGQLFLYELSSKSHLFSEPAQQSLSRSRERAARLADSSRSPF